MGDRFVVRPGEKVATDGVVESGSSDEVVGAAINVGGRLVVRATKIGADTALAQIAKLVEDAQTGKAAVQRLADRVSEIFVPWYSCSPGSPPCSGFPATSARRSRSAPRSPY
jgi:Cu+-exporting ATPase